MGRLIIEERKTQKEIKRKDRDFNTELPSLQYQKDQGNLVSQLMQTLGLHAFRWLILDRVGACMSMGVHELAAVVYHSYHLLSVLERRRAPFHQHPTPQHCYSNLYLKTNTPKAMSASVCECE